MKTQVYVQIPDGYELACDYMRFPKPGESVLSSSGNVIAIHDADLTAMGLLRVIVRPAWKWPAWLTAPWVLQTPLGFWCACTSNPKWNEMGWLACGELVPLNQQHFDFIPPPCDDWRESLRRNPHLKDAPP